jgi:hypothetical protein
VRAIQPTIDHEVNLATVDDGEKEDKGFLEKIFGGKDDKAKDERADEKKNEDKDKDKG